MAINTAQKTSAVKSTKASTVAAVTTGPAAAAFISAGVGCLAIGIFTTGAELSAGLKSFLQWDAGVGPLSGKTGYGVIIYFIAWAVMHYMWREKNMDLKKSLIIGGVLTLIGLLLTFPPFFLSFSH
ncbi:MAG: hypothetical protein H0T53_15570 [Herpetosiphonaceae bacterium]|nr:hypothetical protein [Herpetosiphonaceae bacterium]